MEKDYDTKAIFGQMEKYQSLLGIKEINAITAAKLLARYRYFEDKGTPIDLHDFLCSKWGGAWRQNIEFEGGEVLDCSQNVMPKIEFLSFETKHEE